MIVNLEKAFEIVKKGGIIIYPTDTAFGIGCRIDNEESVKRLFEIRNRSLDKAVPVLFDSIKEVKKYVLPFGQEVCDLMEKYWPGALTIVLKCKTQKIPSLVRGGASTLGVRIPDHKIVLDLISKIGMPIVGTSANFAGEETPYRFEDLDKNLMSKVDGVLMGETKTKNTSTILDCTVRPWKILRQGLLNLNL
jgi:L-threonylcarbamoyladenylate synthase